MTTTPAPALHTLLNAIAFATRAHQGQLRKDGQTPYVSHVYRVAMIVRDVFGIDDRAVLTAAVLHDTLEDTLTDFDDLQEHFGAEIATWAALLSKDKRLPHAEREAAYEAALRDAPWQVQVCKLADVYDNLLDSAYLAPAKRPSAFARKKRYLDALRHNLQLPAEQPYQTVLQLYHELARPHAS